MRTFFALMLLVGCTVTVDDDDSDPQSSADDFAERLADDLADLAAVPVDVVSTADDLSTRDVDEACYPTVGTCSLCYSVDGNPLAGAFTVAMEDVPCGVAWDFAGRTLNYSVEATSIAGDWAATGLGGDYSVNASGSRRAQLSTRSARAGVQDFDSSWDLTTLSAVVRDLSLDSFVLDLTYTGFAGHVWTADITGDSDGIVTATVTSETGGTCTVSGGYEAPSVACTAR